MSLSETLQHGVAAGEDQLEDVRVVLRQQLDEAADLVEGGIVCRIADLVRVPEPVELVAWRDEDAADVGVRLGGVGAVGAAA